MLDDPRCASEDQDQLPGNAAVSKLSYQSVENPGFLARSQQGVHLECTSMSYS